jgi:hypothetical protein
MNTSAYLKEQKYSGDNKDIGKLRADFKTWGIKVSYSPDEKNRRVIFSSTKQHRQSGEFDAYVSECNGLILQAGTWNPIVIPPRTFKSNVKVDVVNAGFARGEYEVFEASDATMVTLYYFDKSWRMSTVKGFDVTYLKWNNKVYNQAFKEVLRVKGVDVGEFYNSLNKKSCYTFCFTHPEFHPFWRGLPKEDILNVNFVQSVELDSSAVNRTNPFDENQITNQVQVNKFTNVRDIFKELPRSLKGFSNNQNVCFGYILRYKEDVEITQENAMYSHVFLESRLLQTIRRLYYNGQYSLTAREKNMDRTKVIIVNSFLDKKVNEIFIKLFPQFQVDFDRLEQISVKLITKIIDIQTYNSQTEEKEAVAPTESVDKLTSSAEFLLNAFNKVYTLNVKARDSARIVSSFILEPAFVDIFYYLFAEDEATA